MPLFASQRTTLLARVGARFIVLAILFASAYCAAFALRCDFRIPSDAWALFTNTLPWVLAIKLAVAYMMAGFHGWMRYVSFFDLFQLVRSIILASAALVVVDIAFLRPSIPLSILVLDFLLTLVLAGGARASGRFLREFLRPLLRDVFSPGNYKKVLLVGADRTGAVLVNQINFHPRLAYRVVGFLDDNPSVRGISLAGVPVLGTLAEAPRLAAKIGAAEVLVLAGSLGGKRLRAMLDACQKEGAAVKIVANVYDLVNGHSTDPNRLQLRDIDINDLLRREPVKLDTGAIEGLLRGRVVLVTGAGGSIGSEICRQVLTFSPKALLLVERAENNLFEIDRELRALATEAALLPLLADVSDEPRMRDLFEAHRPEVVIHAAAHKHVPMMEINPGEALKNNALGTRLVADLAHEFGLQSFVLISTDKAVNPSSVMGLSKQLAERYVHCLGQESRTRFVIVRFGNVLGSVGSVVPIFQEQVRRGGPVTITHPDMRRYFMTIPEASQLVLQAAAWAKAATSLSSTWASRSASSIWPRTSSAFPAWRRMTWTWCSPACGPAKSCLRSSTSPRKRQPRPRIPRFVSSARGRFPVKR